MVKDKQKFKKFLLMIYNILGYVLFLIAFAILRDGITENNKSIIFFGLLVLVIDLIALYFRNHILLKKK